MTGYIIYYQQEEGGQRLSESTEAATTTIITGLIAGATYSITMVATSSTLPSTETEEQTVTIGTVFILKRDAERVMYIYNVHVLMRDEKEGRRKQANNIHIYFVGYFYILLQ